MSDPPSPVAPAPASDTDALPALAPEPKSGPRVPLGDAFIVALAFVALLAVVYGITSFFDLDVARFGVRPREGWGLIGVLVAPLVHGDFGHLAANALPLAMVGAALIFLYPTCAGIVLATVYLGSGLAVWLFGRSSSHIGASGLVYGMVAFVFVSGIIRRDRRALALALLVSFVYGSLVWGVLPIRPGVSWESHLAGAAIGAVLAIALKGRDRPPPVVYSWEKEEGDVTPL